LDHAELVEPINLATAVREGRFFYTAKQDYESTHERAKLELIKQGWREDSSASINQSIFWRSLAAPDIGEMRVEIDRNVRFEYAGPRGVRYAPAKGWTSVSVHLYAAPPTIWDGLWSLVRHTLHL
jgi:hypothetical protein